VRSGLLGVGLAVVLGPLVAGCGGGGAGRAGAGGTGGHHAAVSQAHLTITPGGGNGADPTGGLSVTATGGRITQVTVHNAGDRTVGRLNAGGTVWRSRWTLDVGRRYSVTATATDAAGRSTRRTVTFQTLKPKQTFDARIVEGYGQTYGVGMPIILYFDHPISDRRAVERALQVSTSKPVTGAWYWDSECGTAPVCLYFRPRHYWPAHTHVRFTGHLNGIEAAPGLYGHHTLTQSFTIGSSLTVLANTAGHYMNVYREGRLFAHWPISSGRPGDDTPNGTYLTIEKGNPVEMKGPGYDLQVPWSVRFTWSGDYLHDAYWSVGEQGFTNVSHGCVNMPPADAELYYKMEVPGDPVTITGSPRAGTWDNGWTEWFLPWHKYLAGSALHEAVVAGPHGSRFVNPASLPGSRVKAPRGKPPAYNSSAA
jgi:lipoprotein-anchoring transpeptidase ErfK/SrfK